jgi:hypothetical protein
LPTPRDDIQSYWKLLPLNATPLTWSSLGGADNVQLGCGVDFGRGDGQYSLNLCEREMG